MLYIHTELQQQNLSLIAIESLQYQTAEAAAAAAAAAAVVAAAAEAATAAATPAAAPSPVKLAK